MTSQSAKQFRRENLILFSDSEDESDNSDDEFETQDLYDCESESDNESVAVKDLKFEKVETEKKKSGRPSRLRGAHKDLPKAKKIPEDAYSCEAKLFDFVYGDKLWEEICLGTNATNGSNEQPHIF